MNLGGSGCLLTIRSPGLLHWQGWRPAVSNCSTHSPFILIVCQTDVNKIRARFLVQKHGIAKVQHGVCQDLNVSGIVHHSKTMFRHPGRWQFGFHLCHAEGHCIYSVFRWQFFQHGSGAIRKSVGMIVVVHCKEAARMMENCLDKRSMSCVCESKNICELR